MRSINRRVSLVIAMCSVANIALADTVFDTQLLNVYTLSHEGSNAHMIKVTADLPGVCDSHRLYIAFEDKELLASALANYLSGKTVNLGYITNAAPITAAGHISGLTCKVISIF